MSIFFVLFCVLITRSPNIRISIFYRYSSRFFLLKNTLLLLNSVLYALILCSRYQSPIGGTQEMSTRLSPLLEVGVAAPQHRTIDIDGSPSEMTPVSCLVPMNPITEHIPLGICSQDAS